MDRPITEPPPANRAARFAQDFGRRVLLTVDTEEEFDWSASFTRDQHGLTHVEAIGRFQEFCEELEVSPVYLVDWPVANDRRAVEIIGTAVRAGRAEVGIQLHPWVNPPFDEDVNERNSFAGNLPPDLERAKFLLLRDRIAEVFGVEPQIYRAGRYGLGTETAKLLRQAGVVVDTSVRANYDYSAFHGPDYSRHPLEPYWVDSDRTLLELPVTTVFFGLLRRQGRPLQRIASRVPRLRGLLSHLGLLERISLTPEGVSASEAIKGIDMAIDDGLPLLVLSFHSPSLAPGHTPYVRTATDLERFYDWFRRIYAYLEMREVVPTTIVEIVAASKR